MKGMAGICFIVVGVISIVLGTFFLFKNNNSSSSWVDPVPSKSGILQEASNTGPEPLDYTLFEEKLTEPQNTPVREVEQPAPSPIPHKGLALPNYSKRRGYTFEKFVGKKFVKEYFTLLEWTSDKYTKGIYAENAKQLNLIYEFAFSDSTYRFAVECKWRKAFYNNEVELATTQQIKNYKAFEKQRGMPVFITLGVGGEPSSPKQLYIIPLSQIFSNKVDQSYIKEFEQVPSRDFFYDYKSQSLIARSQQAVEEQI